LYEVGEDQGHLFFVSEFVPGETLSTVIAGRPLNVRHALDYGTQLADALAEGHAAGMIHRDLRPDNVIVNPKGTAKLLDFGLGDWTSGGAERAGAPDFPATVSGAPFGSIPYMSPEQASARPVDQRTDIFSLGTVLFEMLTGTLPFTASTASDTAAKILGTPAPRPSTVNRTLPPELDAVVQKMLEKDPVERYEMVAMVAADLRAIAASLDVGGSPGRPQGTASPVTTVTRSRAAAVPQRRRRVAPWVWIVLIAAVVTALFFAAGFGARWLSPLVGSGQRSLWRGTEPFPSGPDRFV
jgi:serine/threonine-protein kinase